MFFTLSILDLCVYNIIYVCILYYIICVWQRVNIEDKEKNIIVSKSVINNIGILEQTINNNGLKTRKKMLI